MIDFSQLRNVSLQTVKKPKAARVATPKLPVGNGKLRVFHTGKIYPSQELSDGCGLEYTKRKHAIEGDADSPLVVSGNGLDIFSSKKWNMFPAEIEQEFILACVVPKRESKVSVFGSTKYHKETGEPSNSVHTQGTSAFVKDELLDMITQVFNIDWATTSYVDLEMMFDNALPGHPTNVYFLPKMITKGAKAGTASYVRREDITVMPLSVVHVEPKTQSQLAAEATRAKTNQVTETTIDSPIPGIVQGIDPVQDSIDASAISYEEPVGEAPMPEAQAEEENNIPDLFSSL